MNNYPIINDQNNFLNNLVCCLITRSFLKHTDLNITEFLAKILLFPEDCASSGLLESDQKCLRHGSSSTKPFLSLCKKDNTTIK